MITFFYISLSIYSISLTASLTYWSISVAFAPGFYFSYYANFNNYPIAFCFSIAIGVSIRAAMLLVVYLISSFYYALN